MDFYTPSFKSRFVKWLSTIQDYPKPYDMTFKRIPELLNINVNGLFNEGNPHSGCFASDLKKEKTKEGKYKSYFLKTKMIMDGNNNTVEETARVYCEYSSREEFMADFKARRLALERAITIFIAEGPFSTSSFDIEAGHRGCETETLDYVSESLQQSQSWPSWANMKRKETKVIFQLPYDVPFLNRDQEFDLKYNNGYWYTKFPHYHYTIDNMCQARAGKKGENNVCIAGIKMLYDASNGFLSFDNEYYSKLKTSDARIITSFGDRFVARAESTNLLASLQAKQLGEVPCNVKWSNSHRIDPTRNTSCIHFSAASKGDMFLLFSSIPTDHMTWYYLQLSPKGIAFFFITKNKVINATLKHLLGLIVS